MTPRFRAGAVHIVVTCTNRKSRSVSRALQLRHLPHDAAPVRANAWIGRLKAERTPAVPALDLYTGEHSQTVVELASKVAGHLQLGPAAVREVEQVALLHDIGKVGIPDGILQKRGPLSHEEWAVMRQHPALGARILSSTPSLAHLAAGVRAEHERWDGTGYPDRLREVEIPIASRITLACDAYHAMTSNRPYRHAMPHEVALRELRSNAGTQFDPTVVEALTHILQTQPGRPNPSRARPTPLEEDHR